MWALKNEILETRAREAKLLAFFGGLTNDNKELVVRVSNVILETKQEMLNGFFYSNNDEVHETHKSSIPED